MAPPSPGGRHHSHLSVPRPWALPLSTFLTCDFGVSMSVPSHCHPLVSAFLHSVNIYWIGPGTLARLRRQRQTMPSLPSGDSETIEGNPGRKPQVPYMLWLQRAWVQTWGPALAKAALLPRTRNFFKTQFPQLQN